MAETTFMHSSPWICGYPFNEFPLGSGDKSYITIAITIASEPWQKKVDLVFDSKINYKNIRSSKWGAPKAPPPLVYCILLY